MVVKVKVPVIASLGFHHETPKLFVTSQWTREANKTWHFLIFRWLLAGFYIGALSWSWTNSITSKYGFEFWFIYMTNWGIFLCTFSTTYSAVLTSLFHFNAITMKSESASYRVYWLLSNVSAVFAFVITIVYWAVLFNGTTSGIDVLVHGGNSLGMLIEIWMVRHPIYVIHMVYPIGFGIVYLIYSIIYFFAGGTDAIGRTFIYEVLWWENPGRATSVAIAVLVLAVFLQVFIWFLQKSRSRLHKKIFNVNSLDIVQPTV